MRGVNMSIYIRTATVHDIDQIFDIRTAVKENHLSREELTVLGITETVILDLIENTPCVWVAEFDHRVCGFAIADQDEGSVFAMFVYPDVVGKGIGKALLHTTEQFLFGLFQEIWLETGAKSRAFTFYGQQGWSVVETFENGDVKMIKKRPNLTA